MPETCLFTGGERERETDRQADRQMSTCAQRPVAVHLQDTLIRRKLEARQRLEKVLGFA